MSTTRQPLWRRAVASTLIHLLVLMNSWSIAPPGAFAQERGALPPLPALAGFSRPDRLPVRFPKATVPSAGTAFAAAVAGALQAPPPLVTFFGPKRYTRTAGPPNQFSDTVSKAAWLTGPFTLRIVNGEANGDHRISSAEVKWNGVVIAGPSDFNQNVAVIERVVTMPAATATLAVKLQSGPGRYLTINVAGASGDTEAVDLVIAAPQDQSVTSDTTPDLHVTYADVAAPGGAASGVDVPTFALFVDGTDRTSWVTPGSASATGVVPNGFALALGEHLIRAEIRDLAGNLAVKESRFTVGVAVPQPTITAPANGTAVRGPAVTVTGTFPGSGAGLTVSCDAGTIHADGTISGSNFSCVLPLPDGAHTIQAALVASATAQATTQVQVVVDGTPPTVAVTAPANGAFVQGATVTVAGTVTDTQPVAVMVNGVAAPVSGGQFSLDAAIPGSGATASFLVTAIDAVGNSSDPQTVTVNVLRSALGIALSSPADNTAQTATTVEVRGSTNTDVAVEVEVNGTPVPVTNGQFSTTLTLAEGTHTITATARDGAGRTASVQRTVVIDAGAPELTITAPVAGLVTRAPSVEVRGNVNDATAVTVVVNGQPVPVTNQAFSVDLPVAYEGTFPISVVATDTAGNATPRDVSIHIDRTVPVVEIASPLANGPVLGVPVRVEGFVTDATATTVTVDGVPATVANGRFDATFSNLGEGPHTFTAIATDAAGNVSAPHAVTATIDRTAPTLTLTAPAAGAFVRGPSVTVTGTVSDASAVVVLVNGDPALVEEQQGQRVFTASVPASDGSLTITATAEDAAGNASPPAVVTVTVDATPPVIEILAPTSGTVVSTAMVRVSGRVADASTVSLTVGGVPATVVGGDFTVDVAVVEGPSTIVAHAVDAAGNEGGATVEIVVDRTPPTLVVAAPIEGEFLTSLPTAVSGTVGDLTAVTVTVNGTPAVVDNNGWSLNLAGLADGPQTLTILARDAAGLSTVVTRPVVVDTQPPAVAIAAPADRTITAVDRITVTGTVRDLSLQSLVVNGQPVTATPSGDGLTSTFSLVVMLAEGDTPIEAVARDAGGQPGTARITVTRDALPPTIDITAPERVTARVAGAATVRVHDAQTAVTTVVTLNGSVIETPGTPEFNVPLTIPAGARVGDRVTLVVVATDAAGNATTATRSVRITGDGAVTGQVLSDATGLPLRDVTVEVGTASTTTDAQGQYTFPTTAASARARITAPDAIALDRSVTIVPEVGTTLVDARVTTLAAPIAVPAAGGTYPVGTLAVTVPTLAAPVSLQLTPVSPQALPGLLPLGWSPLVSFDLRANGDLPDGVTVRASGLPANLSDLTIVRYDDTVHAWFATALALGTDAEGRVTLSCPASYTYALVVADTVEPALVATLHAPLPGLEPVAIPLAATSAGLVSPAIISPTGGTAAGTLAVQSPTPLPSGTVVQANVSEVFTLTSGAITSEEARRHDVILYRLPAAPATSLPLDFTPTLSATFPITPSRSFAAATVAQGVVHLDVLAGREAVRGQVGGALPTTVVSGGARVVVPAGALQNDTVITITPTVLSSFLPATGGLVPLAEMTLDFGGQILATAGTLGSDAPALTLAPTDTVLLARVERIAGVPALVAVAHAALQDGRLVSLASPGLPGVTRGGRYVFVQLRVPVGWVQATVTRNSAAMGGVIVADTGLAFVGITDGEGLALVPAAPGSRIVSARTVGGGLSGQAPVTVLDGTPAAVTIAVMGTTTTATVAPADGAVQVPTSAQVTIASPVRLAPVATADVAVTRVADGSVVAVRLLLSGTGQTLAVIPVDRLAPGTAYRLAATTLTDEFNGTVVVPATTFTTAPEAALTVDPTRITVSMPNTQGVVTIAAPAGTLPPSSTVLIVNTGSGEVLSVMAGNDGSVTATLVASIADRLLITVTDPDGRTTSLTRSTFVAADGTTGVNRGGGVVSGPGGVELRVPEGAITGSATFKIAAIDYAATFPNDPPVGVAGAMLGGAMRIETSQQQFAREIDLAFPRPADAPEGAFFYVYRRLLGPNGLVAYETLDHGTVEGTGAHAKVVTASPPFPGYIQSIDAYGPNGVAGGFAGGVLASYAILMWTFDQVAPGRPVPGMITGKVLRPQAVPGQLEPIYVPVAGALVSGVDATGQALPNMQTGATVGVTQADGTFAFWDDTFTGGTVTITASFGGVTRTATAFEAPPDYPKTAAMTGYRYLATVTVTFPPLEPPPPAPAIEVRVFREVNGARVDTNGLVTAGESLIIGFGVPSASPTNQVSILGPTINGEPLAIQPDPLAGTPTGMAQILTTPYVPAQAGSYTIVARALPPFGAPIERLVTFRAATAGGGVDTDPERPPAVITAQTSPRDGAVGVPVSALPQVSFSEPVRNVPGQVFFEDEAGAAVPFAILGTGLEGPIDDLQDANAVVTGLTIQPQVALRYGVRYTLRLGEGIVDLDTPAARPLTAYTTSFTTFGPEQIGETAESLGTGGLVVLGDRAYVAANLPGFITGRTTVRVFDITNPVELAEIPSATPVDFQGQPATIGGAKKDDGTRVLAIGTGRFNIPWGPSNVHLVDVTSDTPQWVGAATVGRDPSDGIVRRTVPVEDQVFTLVAGIGKGLLILDAARMRANMDAARAQGDQGQPYYQMLQQLGLAGQAFGQDAIVATIFLDTGTGQNSLQADLATLSMPVDGVTAPLAITTGRRALALVNPNTTEVLYSGAILSTTDDVVLSAGQATAADFVGPRPVAVVVGWHGTGQRLVAVDLTDSRQPRALGWLDLPAGTLHRAGGLLLRDGIVYLGGTTQTTMVSLADPMQPRSVGTLAGGGFLAVSDTNILLSSSHFYEPARTLRSAALEAVALITRVTMTGLNYDEPSNTDLTESDVQVEFRVVPSRYAVETATVEIARAGTPVGTLNAVISGAGGAAVWPARVAVDRAQAYTAKVTVNPQAERPLHSAAAPLSLVEWVFVNQRGEETPSPVQSNPKPVVTLASVSQSDVAVAADGMTAQVRIRGEVTDAVADVSANGAADIREVEVEGHRLPVSPVAEPVSAWRPYAFRGRFEGTITIKVADGRNVIVARAENLVGGKGWDSVTLNVVQTYPPQAAPAGAWSVDARYADPFTIIAGPLSASEVDEIVLFQGYAEPAGGARLVETAIASGVFEGTTSLGRNSVRLDATGGAPVLSPRFSAGLTIEALAMEDQLFPFHEVGGAAGVYRTPTRRLPTNRLLTIEQTPSVTPTARRELRGAIGFIESDRFGTLQETGLQTDVYTGVLGEAGPVTVRVLDRSGDGNAYGRLLAVVSSQETQEPVLVELEEREPGSGRYLTEIDVVQSEPVSQLAVRPLSTQLASIEQNESAPSDLAEPVFMVAKGLAAAPASAGTVADVGGQPFALTTAAIPSPNSLGAVSPVRVRSAAPIMFVSGPEGRQLPPSLLAVDVADTSQTSLAAAGPVQRRIPREYKLTLERHGRRLQNVRGGGQVVGAAVAARGTTARLVFNYYKEPYKGRLNEVVIGDGVFANVGHVSDGSTNLEFSYIDISVSANAPLGLRSVQLVYRFRGAETRVTLPNALRVTRARMVVFAIDGLAAGQFDHAIQDASDLPRLQSGNSTALNEIFGNALALKRHETATFPPITFTRWATVFSGATPSQTLVPSFNWFNRNALIDPTDGAGPSQFLGMSDPETIYSLYTNTASYNRHHKVDFVYDTLGRKDLRSVVVVQQAGNGRFRTSNNSTWLTGSVLEADELYRSTNSNGFVSGDALDEVATDLTVKEIAARGEDFDLLVVYLAGLDHNLHVDGEMCNDALDGPRPCAELFFKRSLHQHINKIVEQLGDLAATTAFGVFSDHGHVAVDRDAFIDLNDAGTVPRQRFKQVSMANVLRGNQPLRVSNVYRAPAPPSAEQGALGPTFQRPSADVIFVPQFANAHVYVASNAGTGHTPLWTAPPSLATLENIVRRLHKYYVKPALVQPDQELDAFDPARISWESMAVAAILVRVPDPLEPWKGKYKVYAPEYAPCKTYSCPFAGQLRDLSTLTKMGPDVGRIIEQAPQLGEWEYVDVERRVNDDFASVNTGDIVLLANVRNGYQFGSPYRSQHGTLAAADGQVPVAFGVLRAGAGGSTQDLLDPIRVFFEDPYRRAPGPDADLRPKPIEAEAIRRFFAVP